MCMSVLYSTFPVATSSEEAVVSVLTQTITSNQQHENDKCEATKVTGQ